MASDLARAIAALVALDDEFRARQQSRRRLREAAEQVALLLIERTRVGDQATVNGATYATEQVTWPVSSGDHAGEPHPHGARAFLRNDAVLVVAERDSRGRASALSVGPRLGRRRPSTGPVPYDLRIAGEDDHLAFAGEVGAVIEGFQAEVTADAEKLRLASVDLVDALVRLFR